MCNGTCRYSIPHEREYDGQTDRAWLKERCSTGVPLLDGQRVHARHVGSGMDRQIEWPGWRFPSQLIDGGDFFANRSRFENTSHIDKQRGLVLAYN